MGKLKEIILMSGCVKSKINSGKVVYDKGLDKAVKEILKHYINRDEAETKEFEVRNEAYEDGFESANIVGKTIPISEVEEDLDYIFQNDEENIKANLQEQKDQLVGDKQQRVIPLKKLYSRLFRDQKFRKRMGIYTFDRSTRIADFGDIGF